MGYFYNGAHYSTQSNLGPNEKFGKEDDMSFHDFAQNLEKKAKTSSNLQKNEVANNVSISTNNYTVEELLEMLKTQKKELNSLRNENEQLINEKNELIERHRNVLSIKNQNEKELKEQNEKLLSEIKNLKLGMPTQEYDENLNINIAGGKNGKYTDGVYIDSFDGKFGKILKFSINLKRFSQNNRVTPKGYVYFEVKKSQSGKYYATPQKFFNQDI